ncbi:MAG: citrate lyase holo-[Alloprevotella sp.]|nr:citrate lyase holo-[acyl-carrier protein] synthase [Alloprevotella sp.]
MQGVEITLEQMLASRDARQQKQQSLLHDNPAKTLVCLTVVFPGSIKRNADSLIVAHKAVKALQESFPDSDIEISDLPTGFEAFLLTDEPAHAVKQKTVRIEDTHPLGRLFDADVLTADGIPLSRHDIGAQPRKCLLCDHEARYCMRNHTHSTDELLQHIHNLVALNV